jgi:hypothetical protein
VAGNAGNNFDQSGGGKLIHINQNLHACRPQLGSAHPHHVSGRAAAMEGLKEMAAMEIA